MVKSFMTLAILWLILILLLTGVRAHETPEMKHSGTGTCYGWMDLGDGVRVAFANPENTLCKLIIYSHGMFRVSEILSCSTLLPIVDTAPPTGAE